MFLIIEASGRTYKSEEVTDAMYEDADNCWLFIVNISGNQPTQYRRGDYYGISNYVEPVV